jgi:hypothetical protein
LSFAALAWQAMLARDRARAAQASAELELASERQTRGFLLSVFQLADADEARGSQVTVREVLDRAVQRIDSTAFDRPAIKSRYLATMGKAYSSLGLNRRGSELLRASLQAIGDDLAADESWDQYADSQIELADLGFDMGDYPGALAALDALGQRVEQSKRPLTAARQARALNVRGDILAYTEQDAAARAAYESALAALAAGGPDAAAQSIERGHGLYGLGQLAMFGGNYAEADQRLAEAGSLFEAMLGPFNPRTITTQISRGANAYRRQDRAAARRAWNAALDAAGKVYDADSPQIGTLKNNLGRLELESGHLDVAEPLVRAALASDRKHRGAGFDDLVFPLTNLAVIRAARGDADEARALLEEALPIAQTHDHQMLGVVLNHLGDLACTRGDARDGLALAERALTETRRRHGDADWRVAQAHLTRQYCRPRGRPARRRAEPGGNRRDGAPRDCRRQPFQPACAGATGCVASSVAEIRARLRHPRNPGATTEHTPNELDTRRRRRSFARPYPSRQGQRPEAQGRRSAAARGAGNQCVERGDARTRAPRGGKLDRRRGLCARIPRARPYDPLLAHVRSIALARLGAVERAQAELQQILAWCGEHGAAAVVRSEVLSALARTQKDLGFSAAEPETRSAHLRDALAFYRSAFAADGSLYSGVNVAALAFLLGDIGDADAVASSVIREAERKLQGLADDAAFDDRYWLLASIAECHLIRGNDAGAEAYYRSASLHAACAAALRRPRLDSRAGLAARGRARARRQRHRSTDSAARRGDVQRSSLRRGRTAERAVSRSVGACARRRSVALVRGRRCRVRFLLPLGGRGPRPGRDRATPRGRGSCAAARGAESLFRCDRSRWGAAWRARLEGCTARAASLTVASPKTVAPGDFDYQYTNDMMTGLALRRSAELSGRALGLAVWNGDPAAGPGGTATVVASWVARGIPVVVLRPRDAGGAIESVQPLSPELGAACARERAPADASYAFVFADFRGFSGLREDLVQTFVRVVMGGVAKILQRSDAAGTGPLARNTWGDGLFLVFRRAGAAARLSLELLEWMACAESEFRDAGLPSHLSVRIALHAGPATEVDDPITGQASCVGAHVSHAARLEPATPPGLAYGSSAFAAMLALEAPADVSSRFIGTIEWSKGHGQYPTYRILRTAVGAARAPASASA